ncbi:hypothetical protein [Actinocrispum sp. NPDC049592]|uniref:hypothetical protein n=1 Tax=Actinocrispum sp. NPDC049592 TaxID=3154835 RepID=UPI00343769F4
MTGRPLWTQWLTGDVTVRSAILVRLVALFMAGNALVFVAGRFASIWQPFALYAVMVVQTAAVVTGWRRKGMAAAPYTLELVTGMGLLLVNGLIASDADARTWELFTYPYTVMITFSAGLLCRTLAASWVLGVCWLGCYVAVLLTHGTSLPDALAGTPTYLANPVIGWLSARVFRRDLRELDAARSAAVVRAAELAAQRVRARSAWALHDRVLQTLETLARGTQVTDPALRDRVVTEAAWLRAFVESDGARQEHDLTLGLDTAARMARAAGLAVEVNYAAFLTDEGVPRLPGPQRVALVEATHEALEAMAGGCREAVVQARRSDGGVVVSVLGRCEPGVLLDTEAVEKHLAQAGGRVVVADPTPYLELWVPGG